jgi:hypothetical protein
VQRETVLPLSRAKPEVMRIAQTRPANLQPFQHTSAGARAMLDWVSWPMVTRWTSKEGQFAMPPIADMLLHCVNDALCHFRLSAAQQFTVRLAPDRSRGSCDGV